MVLTLTEEEEDKESLEDEFHGDDMVSLEEPEDLGNKDRAGQGGGLVMTCSRADPPSARRLQHLSCTATHTHNSR